MLGLKFAFFRPETIKSHVHNVFHRLIDEHRHKRDNTQSSKNRTPLLKTTHLLEGLLREVHTLVNDHTRKQETTKNLEGELFGERPGHVLLVLVCMICHKAYISDNVGYRNSITEADVFRVHDGPKGLTNVTRESHLFSCSSKYYKYNINRPRISIVHVVHTESNNVSYWDSPYLMYSPKPVLLFAKVVYPSTTCRSTLCDLLCTQLSSLFFGGFNEDIIETRGVDSQSKFLSLRVYSFIFSQTLPLFG